LKSGEAHRTEKKGSSSRSLIKMDSFNSILSPLFFSGGGIDGMIKECDFCAFNFEWMPQLWNDIGNR